MTHAKRIRSSKEAEKLDILLTTRSNFESSIGGFEEVARMIGVVIKEEDDKESRIKEIAQEVEIPHLMIYRKDVFDKFKGYWPLTFSSQPPGFSFVPPL